MTQSKVALYYISSFQQKIHFDWIHFSFIHQRREFQQLMQRFMSQKVQQQVARLLIIPVAFNGVFLLCYLKLKRITIYTTRSVAYYPRDGQNYLPPLPDRPFAPPDFPIPYRRSFHAFPAKTSSMTHGGKTGYNGVPRMEKSW